MREHYPAQYGTGRQEGSSGRKRAGGRKDAGRDKRPGRQHASWRRQGWSGDMRRERTAVSRKEDFCGLLFRRRNQRDRDSPFPPVERTKADDQGRSKWRCYRRSGLSRRHYDLQACAEVASQPFSIHQLGGPEFSRNGHAESGLVRFQRPRRRHPHAGRDVGWCELGRHDKCPVCGRQISSGVWTGGRDSGGHAGLLRAGRRGGRGRRC